MPADNKQLAAIGDVTSNSVFLKPPNKFALKLFFETKNPVNIFYYRVLFVVEGNYIICLSKLLWQLNKTNFYHHSFMELLD